jgi:hypothetical protein
LWNAPRGNETKYGRLMLVEIEQVQEYGRLMLVETEQVPKTGLAIKLATDHPETTCEPIRIVSSEIGCSNGITTCNVLAAASTNFQSKVTTANQ